MSGYKHKETDLDLLFEPLAPGDPKYGSPVGTVDTNGVDATNKYTSVTAGTEVSENVGYQHNGTDFKKIFAALGSVTRFLEPLPWERTVAPSAAVSFYRQASRALITTMDVTCKILADGHTEIKLAKPNLHSHPTNKIVDTFYALTSTPAWDDSQTPNGTNYQIRFDVTNNANFSLDSGLSFGTWIDMPSGHAGAMLRGSLSYRHDTTGTGVKSDTGTVKISVRRKDNPTTNKTEGVLTANLSMTVLAPLFQDVSSWTKINSVINDLSNPHQPDGTTTDHSAACSVHILADGSLQHKTKVQQGLWNTVLNTRWLASGSPVAASDFQVKCSVDSTATSAGTETFTNPISNWTDINSTKVVSLVKTVNSSESPGLYRCTYRLDFEFRQKSTAGWSGVVDNFVEGQISLAADVEIGAANAPDWSGMTLPNLSRYLDIESDSGAVDPWVTTGVRWLMKSSTSVSSFHAEGQGIVGNDGGFDDVIETSRIVPTGWNPSLFEWRFRQLSGNAPTDSNDGVWLGLDGNSHAIACVASRTHGEGAGNTSITRNLAIDVRRKAYHSHAHTFTSNLSAEVRMTLEAPNWDGMTLPDLDTSFDVPGGTSGTYQASVSFQVWSSTSETDTHVRAQEWNFNGNESEGYVDQYLTRLVPVGWNPNDFEWKFDIVSQPSSGFVNIDGVGNEGDWLPVYSGKRLQAKLFMAGIQSPGTTVTCDARVNITIRKIDRTEFTHTFSNVRMRAVLNYVTPDVTLTPESSYTTWGGTYGDIYDVPF